MNIHESCLASIRVDSGFQRTLNRMCVQRIENALETGIRRTNTQASEYLHKLIMIENICSRVFKRAAV